MFGRDDRCLMSDQVKSGCNLILCIVYYYMRICAVARVGLEST